MFIAHPLSNTLPRSRNDIVSGEEPCPPGPPHPGPVLGSLASPLAVSSSSVGRFCWKSSEGGARCPGKRLRLGGGGRPSQFTASRSQSQSPPLRLGFPCVAPPWEAQTPVLLHLLSSEVIRLPKIFKEFSAFLISRREVTPVCCHQVAVCPVTSPSPSLLGVHSHWGAYFITFGEGKCIRARECDSPRVLTSSTWRDSDQPP